MMPSLFGCQSSNDWNQKDSLSVPVYIMIILEYVNKNASEHAAIN